MAEGQREMPESGDLVELYAAMVDNAGARIADVARLVAASEGPSLVHCAVGKDRTGVSVAILLSAVGVNRADIVADYDATGPNMPAVLSRYQAIAQARSKDSEPFDFSTLPPGLLDTNTAAIEAVLDVVEAHDGGAAGWLLAHGLTDAELEQLRTRLVD
jgi:protein tyrosine/serine phosphatase